MVGLVGRDQWGAKCLRALDKVGVDRRYVGVTDHARTGADFFEGDDWRIERGANWLLSAEHVTRSLIALHAEKPLKALIVNQGISSPASEAALRFANEHDIFVALNLAPEAVEPARRIDPALFHQTHLVVVNQIEADVLYEDLNLGPRQADAASQARALHDAVRPRGAFVQTLGADGATVIMQRGETVRSGSSPAHAAPVSSTEHVIGAGDALLAAMVVKLTSGKNELSNFTWRELTNAVSFGMDAAAIKLQHPGTMTPMLLDPSPMSSLTISAVPSLAPTVEGEGLSGVC